MEFRGYSSNIRIIPSQSVNLKEPPWDNTESFNWLSMTKLNYIVRWLPFHNKHGSTAQSISVGLNLGAHLGIMISPSAEHCLISLRRVIVINWLLLRLLCGGHGDGEMLSV